MGLTPCQQDHQVGRERIRAISKWEEDSNIKGQRRRGPRDEHGGSECDI